MEDDIASAIAEFVQQGGEIKQLPDQVYSNISTRPGQTRFNFVPETRIIVPPRGPIRSNYSSDGKHLNQKALELATTNRRMAIKRSKMHSEIAYLKRRERLSTISRY